jgi:hypothetical protein
MTETESTFSDDIERLGATAFSSLVVFLTITSLLNHFVFSIILDDLDFSTVVSVIVSLFLTILYTVTLLRMPIKETEFFVKQL